MIWNFGGKGVPRMFGGISYMDISMKPHEKCEILHVNWWRIFLTGRWGDSKWEVDPKITLKLHDLRFPIWILCGSPWFWAVAFQHAEVMKVLSQFPSYSYIQKIYCFVAFLHLHSLFSLKDGDCWIWFLVELALSFDTWMASFGLAVVSFSKNSKQHATSKFTGFLEQSDFEVILFLNSKEIRMSADWVELSLGHIWWLLGIFFPQIHWDLFLEGFSICFGNFRISIIIQGLDISGLEIPVAWYIFISQMMIKLDIFLLVCWENPGEILLIWDLSCC